MKETSEILLENKNVLIKKIVSPGGFASGIFKQNDDEWVTVTQGSALLEIDGKEVSLPKNGHIFIPRNTPHKILNTIGETVWIAVHMK